MGKSKDLATLTNGGNITGDLTVDTDTLKVDSSNDRVLINTTTEGRDSEGADILTIAAPDDGHSGITVRSGTSSYGSLYFSDATSGAGEYAGSMQFNHSNNQLALGVAGSDYLKIDSSGHVTKPNNPWLNVQGAGGWISFAVGENQLTNIYTSSTVYQNTGGGFNRSNATYTAPVAGRYCFMWNTYTKGGSNNASTAYVYPRLYKNGSAIHPRSNILHYTEGTNYDTGTESTILTDLAANDTIVAGCYSNTNTNQYYGAAMQLQMFFVG